MMKRDSLFGLHAPFFCERSVNFKYLCLKAKPDTILFRAGCRLNIAHNGKIVWAAGGEGGGRAHLLGLRD